MAVKPDNELQLNIMPPHIRHYNSVSSVMTDVIMAALPALIWGVVAYGARALVVVLLAVLSSVGFELLSGLIFKRRSAYTDLSAALTGLILGLTLPASVPYYVPPIGAFFAVFVAKQLFGGLGKNIFNPALFGRAVLYVLPLGTETITPAFEKPDWKSIVIAQDTDGTVSSVLSELLKGNESPTTLMDLFIGKENGNIGEISAMLLLLGGIYLMTRKIISWRTPAAFIVTAGALAMAFPENTADRFDFALSYILCGSIMLCAFFCANDSVTSPMGDRGKLLFGVGCGALTFFFRKLIPSFDGAVTAVLAMNLLTYIIDRIIHNEPLKRKKAKDPE